VVFDEVVLGAEAALCGALARGREEARALIFRHVEVNRLEESAGDEAAR
jgi:hypothetical protein